MGDYKNPKICDDELLNNISKKFEKVEIRCTDYKNCIDYIDENTLIYFDPPYRPLNITSSFNSYTEDGFSDEKQIELAIFIKKITEKNVNLF